MVTNCLCSRRFLSRLAIAASTFALLSLPFAVQAQTPSVASENGRQYSSSADWKAYVSNYDFDGVPGASASPQYGHYPRNNNNYPYSNSRWSHVALEFGGGFTAPIGNDTGSANSPAWDGKGYNITLGGGWNFSKWLGTLLEFQFNRNTIPQTTLTLIGVPSGNINTWSLTLDPIIYLPMMTHSFGAYVTGGGGFYRKVTNFSAPAPVGECTYFGCYYSYQNQTIGHFSSNQGGMNIGLGTFWKAFGPDSNAKLYAEARYVWVDSPTGSATENGEGTEGLIPVTFGIRF